MGFFVMVAVSDGIFLCGTFFTSLEARITEKLFALK
jgi:hypothetical protein